MKEQDAATSCPVRIAYSLFLAGFRLGQSAASDALGSLAVTAIREDFGCFGRYRLAGLLRVLSCHRLLLLSLIMWHYTT